MLPHAPDISYSDGQYSLFYSISTFGKNRSASGLATNKTLDPKLKDFQWIDHGAVVESVPGRDMWNAIDPALIRDERGTPWLAFGSFWNDIKLMQLWPDLGGPVAAAQWCTLARSQALADSLPGDGAIEEPFIFRHAGYYYLFVSFGYCCRGPQSTYKMMVSRARTVTSPYLDQAGGPMAQGGGPLVLQGDADWHGVGHNAVPTFDHADCLLFHGYDSHDQGRPQRRIEPLAWSPEGWPTVALKP